MALDILKGGNKGPIPVTAKEEKELRRVFLMLCNYQRKTRILVEIEELNDLLSGNTKTLTDAKRQDQIVNYDLYMNNAAATNDRIQELENEFQRLAARTEDKISVGDVTEMLKRQGQKVSIVLSGIEVYRKSLCL